MKCIRVKSKGMGGCMKGTLTQNGCSRKGTTVRVAKNGKEVTLCKKCDAAFGHIVGIVK